MLQIIDAGHFYFSSRFKYLTHTKIHRYFGAQVVQQGFHGTIACFGHWYSNTLNITEWISWRRWMNLARNESHDLNFLYDIYLKMIIAQFIEEDGLGRIRSSKRSFCVIVGFYHAVDWYRQIWYGRHFGTLLSCRQRKINVIQNKAAASVKEKMQRERKMPANLLHTKLLNISVWIEFIRRAGCAWLIRTTLIVYETCVTKATANEEKQHVQKKPSPSFFNSRRLRYRLENLIGNLPSKTKHLLPFSMA